MLDLVTRDGSGINIASLQVLRPNPGGLDDTFSSGPETLLPSVHPDAASIKRAIERGLREGALGTKILGGHFPFTPEATVRIIEESTRLGGCTAFHLGTTETGSNIEGLREALCMAKQDRRIHTVT